MVIQSHSYSHNGVMIYEQDLEHFKNTSYMSHVLSFFVNTCTLYILNENQQTLPLKYIRSGNSHVPILEEIFPLKNTQLE